MVHFYSFGRPKSTVPSLDSRVVHSPTKLDSCVSSSLVSSDSKYAYIDCGFTHDTIWHGEDLVSSSGVAAVKFHLHTRHKTDRHLHRVECSLTFSQPDGKQFHSVHRCWPSLRGVPNLRQVNNALEFAPAVSAGGVDVSLGGASREIAKSMQSNWTVTTQQRQSEGQAGKRYDMVAVVWDALDANDQISWSDRKLYAAAVLRCAKGDLVVTSLLQGFKKSRHISGGTRFFQKCLANSQVQFTMTPETENKDLDTLCAEVEQWTKEENGKSVQTLE